MDLFIRPMTEQEQLYAYRQSSQIAGQTGNIGYLRGDFGSGGEQFYTTWEDIRSDFKTDTFKTEFDNVVNALRFDERYGLLIGDRRTLAQYCARFPESLMKGSDRWYGFRIESGDYSYLLRLSSTQGDYNFYINCYKQDFFNSHMKRLGQYLSYLPVCRGDGALWEYGHTPPLLSPGAVLQHSPGHRHDRHSEKGRNGLLQDGYSLYGYRGGKRNCRSG